LRKKYARKRRKNNNKDIQDELSHDERDTNDKDNQDELSHDERVDIFYDPNKVSKGDIFIG
jgi:hypothetical protein